MQDWNDDNRLPSALERLGKTTDMLCRTLTHMEQSTLVSVDWLLKNPDIAQWWKDHQAADKARKEREEAEKRRTILRNAALKKLTKEERLLLGVKKK